MSKGNDLRPKFIVLANITSKVAIPLWLKEMALILNKANGKILGHFNLVDF